MRANYKNLSYAGKLRRIFKLKIFNSIDKIQPVS